NVAHLERRLSVELIAVEVDLLPGRIALEDEGNLGRARHQPRVQGHSLAGIELDIVLFGLVTLALYDHLVGSGRLGERNGGLLGDDDIVDEHLDVARERGDRDGARPPDVPDDHHQTEDEDPGDEGGIGQKRTTPDGWSLPEGGGRRTIARR